MFVLSYHWDTKERRKNTRITLLCLEMFFSESYGESVFSLISIIFQYKTPSTPSNTVTSGPDVFVLSYHWGTKERRKITRITLLCLEIFFSESYGESVFSLISIIFQYQAPSAPSKTVTSGPDVFVLNYHWDTKEPRKITKITLLWLEIFLEKVTGKVNFDIFQPCFNTKLLLSQRTLPHQDQICLY